MKRTISLFPISHILILIAFLTVSTSLFADNDWKVRDRAHRHQIILKRFQQILERRPYRGFALKRMIQLARRSPGLDHLISRYRQKIKRSPQNFAYHLILGHLYLQTKQKLSALKHYRIASKLKPRNIRILLYLASLHQQMGHYAKALPIYQKALQIARRNIDRKRCLKALGTLHLLLKKPKKALLFWKKYLQLSPKNNLARAQIAQSLVQEKLYKEALEQWQIILKNTRSSAEKARILRKMGDIQVLAGHWLKGVALYRKAMSYTRRGHWLRRELSERILQLHREQGQLPHLIQYLKKKKKKNTSELAMLARLLDEIGKDKEAYHFYKQALRRAPRNTHLRIKFITLLEVNGKISEAIRQYKQLIKFEPREPRYRLAFSEMLSREGRPHEALLEMKKLARTFSRNSEILLRLARFYRQRHLENEAIKLYRRLIQIAPRNPNYRRELGNYYYQLGKLNKAHRVWRSLLKSPIPRDRAYALLGQIYLSHHKLQAALKAFQKAVKLKPKKLPYLIQLAELYTSLQDEEGLKPKQLKYAIHLWTKIYHKSHSLSLRQKALHNIFSLSRELGTLYRLPAYYKAQIKQHPKTKRERRRTLTALHFLGAYYLWLAKRRRNGDFYQAKHIYLKILELNPRDIDALLTLEQLAARERHWKKARHYLLRLVIFHKKNRKQYYRKIYNYSLRLGNYDAAIRYGRKVLELNPDDPSAHAELARIYDKVGQEEKAIEAYREAIRLSPFSQNYRLALADLLTRREKYSKAFEIFRSVMKQARNSETIYTAATRAIDIALLDPKRIERLKGDLRNLADLHPRELAYFRALAELYKRLGRFKEYRIAYLKAAATVDQKAQVYRTLGKVAEKQGNLKKAIIYYQKMLEEFLHPSQTEQFHLAKLYFQIGDRKNAKKLLLLLLQEHPKSLNVLYKIGNLLYKNKLPFQAMLPYERLLDLDPDNGEIRLKLAKIYILKKEYEAAIGLLESIFFGELGEKLPSKKKKKKKIKLRKIRRRFLPYYLRKKRRKKLQRLYSFNDAALQTLLRLYDRNGQFDEWERRLIFFFQKKIFNLRQAALTKTLQYLEQHGQIERMERLLKKTLHFGLSEQLLRKLVRIYEKKGLYEKALRLYLKISHRTRRHRFKYILPISKLYLKLKRYRRLELLIDNFLHSHMRFNWRYWALLKLLKKNNRSHLFEKMLNWGERYWANDKIYFKKKIIELYLELGLFHNSKKLIWEEWFQFMNSSKKIRTLYRAFAERSKILDSLLLILDQHGRQKLLDYSLNLLVDSLLKENNINRSYNQLFNAYIAVRKLKGAYFASFYLPAIWPLTNPQSFYSLSFRIRMLKELLTMRNIEVFNKIFDFEMGRAHNSSQRIRFMRYLISRLLSQILYSPPRSFTLHIELQLMNLRNKMNPYWWQYMTKKLAQYYDYWGQPKLAIWLLERQRWLTPKIFYKHDDQVLLLANIYKKLGYLQKSQKLIELVFQKNWKLLQQKHKKFIQYIRRLWQRKEVSHILFKTLQKKALPSHWSFFIKFNKRDTIFKILWKNYKLAQKQPDKLAHGLILSATLFQDWFFYNHPQSIKKWLNIVHDIQKFKIFPKKYWPFFQLYAAEKKLGHEKKSLRYLKLKIRFSGKSSPKFDLKYLAKNYENIGKQHQAYLVQRRLFQRYKSPHAARWLAYYKAEKGNIQEALRFYKAYLKLKRSNYHQRYFLKKYKVIKSHLHLELATFYITIYRPKLAQKELDLAFNYFLKAPQKIITNYYLAFFIQKIFYLARQAGNLNQLIGKLRHIARQHPSSKYLTYLNLAYNFIPKDNLYAQTLKTLRTLGLSSRKVIIKLERYYRQRERSQEFLSFLKTFLPQKSSFFYKTLAYHYEIQGKFKQARKAWDLSIQYSFEKGTPRSISYTLQQIAEALLTSGHFKRSLALFQKILFLRKNRWTLTSIFKKFLARKRYKEALNLLNFLNFSHILRQKKMLTERDITLLKSQLQIYDQKGELEKKEKLLNILEGKNYTDMDTLEEMATLLSRSGHFLAAERLYWLKLKLYSQRYFQKTWSKLCDLWQRGGLDFLCQSQSHLLWSQIPATSRWQFAQKMKKAGYPLLAFGVLRQLWLEEPDALKRWKKLAYAALNLGRTEDLKALLRYAHHFHRHSWPSSLLKKLEAQLSQLPPDRHLLRPMKSGRPSRLIWKLWVKGYCQKAQFAQGKLFLSRCHRANERLRCHRILKRWGNLLISNDCQGRVMAFHAQSGQIAWLYALPPLVEKEEQKISRRYYLLHRVRPLRIHRYNLASAALHRGKLYLAFNELWIEKAKSWIAGFYARIHLIALDARSGHLLWKRSIREDFVSGNIQVHHGLLTYFGRHFKALDAMTGKDRWIYENSGNFGTFLFNEFPTRLHKKVPDGYLVVGKGNIIHHIDITGHKIWKKSFHWKPFTLTVSGDRFYTITFDGTLHALHIKDGRKIWQKRLRGSVALRDVRYSKLYNVRKHSFNEPKIVGKTLIYWGSAGYLTSLSTETGKEFWRRKVGDFGFWQPTIDERKGIIFLAQPEGSLSAYALRTGRRLWSYLFPPQRILGLFNDLMTEIQTSLSFDAQHFWIGYYDLKNRFQIVKLARQATHVLKSMDFLLQHEKVMPAQQLSKEKIFERELLLDPNDSFLHKHFLPLIRTQNLPLASRFYWSFSYLNTSAALDKVEDELLSILQNELIFPKKKNFFSLSEKERRIQLVRWLLHLRLLEKRESTAFLPVWEQILFKKKESFYKFNTAPMHLQLSRLLRQDGKKRLLAAYHLGLLQDREAGPVLLQILLDSMNSSVIPLSPEKRVKLAHLLTNWDIYTLGKWYGLIGPYERHKAMRLLNDHSRQIRWRIALFVMTFALENRVKDSPFEGPNVRQILADAAENDYGGLSQIASYYLAELGELRGIRFLRLWLTRGTFSQRRRIASYLLENYEDYSGRDLLLASYRGRYTFKLGFPLFRLFYGSRLCEGGFFQKGLKELKAAITMPNVEFLHRRLFYESSYFCHKKAKHLSASLNTLKKLKNILGAHRSFAAQKAELLYQMGKKEKAYRIFKTLWKEDFSLTARSRYYFALGLFAHGRQQAAQQLFERRLKREPFWTSGYYFYAKALFKVKKLTLALKQLEKFLKFVQNWPEGYYLKAQLLYQLGQKEKALKILRKITRFISDKNPQKIKYLKLLRRWNKRE